jgi:hypothetical protein
MAGSRLKSGARRTWETEEGQANQLMSRMRERGKQTPQATSGISHRT